MESERQRKRVSLVGDNKDGGLKGPNLESIIKTHRIMLRQRIADEEPCNWSYFISLFETGREEVHPLL